MDTLNQGMKNTEIGFTGPKQNKSVNSRMMAFTKLNSCICCGAWNVGLIKMISCSHIDFLECYFKNRINFTVSLLCQYCHAILRKIDKFKKQVEQCIIKQKKPPKATLTIQKPMLTMIEPQNTQENNMPNQPVPAEQAMCKEIENIKRESGMQDVRETREIKVEFEYMNKDMDIDETLVEKPPVQLKPLKDTSKDRIPLTPELLPTPPKTDSKSRQKESVKKELRSKVLIVTQSREELERERDMERKSEKYLKRIFRCEDCIVSFAHQDNLDGHMKKHDTTEGDFVCEVCKSVYITKARLQKHEKTHWRRYQCVPCGMRFKENIFICVSHYNQEHGKDGQAIDKTFECKKGDCGFKTNDFLLYRRHRRGCHTSKACCEECAKVFANMASLQKHMASVHHRIPRTYKCPECPRQYKTYSSQLVHWREEHSNADKPLCFCDECGRQYKNKQVLNAHMKMHRRDKLDGKKYVCDHCGAKFSYKTGIKNHIDRHHLKTEYKCSHCDKVYHIQRTLVQHIQSKHSSTPPRKILCDLCGNGFLSTANLRRHMITHTGERPYKCNLCSATFGFSAALYTHKKLVHKQQKINK